MIFVRSAGARRCQDHPLSRCRTNWWLRASYRKAITRVHRHPLPPKCRMAKYPRLTIIPAKGSPCTPPHPLHRTTLSFLAVRRYRPCPLPASKSKGRVVSVFIRSYRLRRMITRSFLPSWLISPVALARIEKLGGRSARKGLYCAEARLYRKKESNQLKRSLPENRMRIKIRWLLCKYFSS